jgi:hypothetical protein
VIRDAVANDPASDDDGTGVVRHGAHRYSAT